MSLASCVNEALKAKRISKEMADKLLRDDAPEEMVIKGALEDAALRKRQAALQAVKLKEAIDLAKGHEKGFKVGVSSLLTRDITGKAGYGNIESRAKVILGGFHKKLANMLDAYRSKKAGFAQDKEGMRRMVRELFGEATGDADAATFAKAWAEVSDEARIRFNRAGGNIKKNKNWRLPQFHDQLMVSKAKAREWAKYVKDKINPLTDDMGKVLPEEDQLKILEEMHASISTNGANKIEPGRFKVGGKVGNRRQEARVLDFKDADSWLEYQDKFGSKDTFTVLNDHLKGMADDTALMEVLGPNPSNAFNYLMDSLRKEGVSTGQVNILRDTMRELAGIGSIETSARLANAGAAVRSSISSALLGGAFLSSVTDVVSNAITSRFNGIPAARTMSRLLKQFNPKNAADRKLAVELGLVADGWMNRSLGANRYLESMGKGVMGKLSDITMRTSLLSPWTEAGRQAFGMEFASLVARNLKKPIKELPEALQKSFKRYGLDESDWAKLQKAKPIKHKGAEFLGEDAIAKMDLPEAEKNELAAKYMGMILQETDLAVPTPDARVRAIGTLGTQKGTLIGEFWRSLIMFKSFPITMVTTHLYRAAMAEGVRGKAAYAAQMVIGGTIMGALAIQLKDIAKGKEPRPMDNTKFWSAAFIQSGGVGIFGDFLFADHNRFGGGFGATVTGPVVGMAEDIGKLTFGNIQEAAKGEDTNVAGETISFVNRYKPVLSQWYIKLALERMIVQQAELMADPKMRKKYQRMMKNAKKDYNQDYWWKPGEPLPED